MNIKQNIGNTFTKTAKIWIKTDAAGDLEITPAGDICTTSSVAQAVRIRLRWFLGEWRLIAEQTAQQTEPP